MSSQLAKHWFTADEYERMGEAGIFDGDARLELIEGEIYKMSPIGNPHAACVTILTTILYELAQRRYIVRVQNPVRLNDFSEPQPDVALIKWRDDFYRSGHPQPEDVLLLIEVSDSTVQIDRAVKIPLYARSGIREAWIVNITDGQIEVYAEPTGSTYRITKVFNRSEDAHAHTLPELVVSAANLFG